ncbi:hypothetical protein LOCC1_G008738 [Lachnellula occidentalis]|uniref:Uncharacterized protein n=1 Tax=Lachnellula occidentalis TaxID=215460 RepID=A0A8H8U7E1_9HELO|nr:hypothetical protein LOCC1_G008738 [Lachnellula occidentalis]
MDRLRRGLPSNSRHQILNLEQYATNSRLVPGQMPGNGDANRDKPFPGSIEPERCRQDMGSRMQSRLDGPQLPSYDPRLIAGSRMSRRLDGPQLQPQSTLKTSYDVKMATRQTQIESLSSAERKEQDKWAQTQLSQHSTCVMGLGWLKNNRGYQCSGGGHLVTHELLAEGKGGVYHHIDDYWLGPLYGQEIIDSMNRRLNPRRERELTSSAIRKGHGPSLVRRR